MRRLAESDGIPPWQHDALLRSIEAVDYAPPTLAQVKAQQARTQTQLDGDIKKLKALEAATYVFSCLPRDSRADQWNSKKEYAEWIAIRDRTHKRVWTKISHPRSNKEILSAKEQKEEREYLEAFAEEQKLRAEKGALEQQIQQMEDEVRFLAGFRRWIG